MPKEQDEKGTGEIGVRIVEAGRQQVGLRAFHLDGTIPGDHPVRAIRAFVEGVDLSAWEVRGRWTG